MKTKNFFHVFLIAAFVFGTITMNAQTNLLVNPGFEVPDSDDENDPNSDVLREPWMAVPEDWFTSYYDAPTISAYNPGNRASMASNNGAGAFFTTGNGAPIKDILHDNYAGRLTPSNTSGIYQLVNVTPGEYKVSFLAAISKNNANQTIHSDSIMKVLSEDGTILYGHVGIPLNDLVTSGNSQTLTSTYVSEKVDIPEGVTQVRFQFDQRDYTAAPGGRGRAPLMLFDECEFTKVEHVGVNSRKQETFIAVFPNPAQEMLTVNGAPKDAIINMYGMSGELLQTITSQGNSTNINISFLPQGIYALQIDKQLIKFIKK